MVTVVIQVIVHSKIKMYKAKLMPPAAMSVSKREFLSNFLTNFVLAFWIAGIAVVQNKINFLMFDEPLGNQHPLSCEIPVLH